MIAKSLLSCNAVFLSPNKPFTWASGIKSPIYCDNRLTLSYPLIRREIKNGLALKINEYFKDCEMVFGTATAGIPHAALVGDVLDLPMGYVRGSKKGHGLQNQIEGKIYEGMKVVVIEDLISTGSSVIECVNILKKAGCIVLGVVAIFTYDLEQGKQNFLENKIALQTLVSYDELMLAAIAENYINLEDLKKLRKWKKNPNDEGWME